MILITDSTEFVDSFFEAMNRIANQEHVPMGKHPKAAPPHVSEVNFIFATCSCGWRGKRPCETQEQALKNATEHANTLNGCTLPDDPTSVRFIVEGGDHIGWFVIDLEDGGRVMDDACGTRAEAEEAAREYADPS